MKSLQSEHDQLNAKRKEERSGFAVASRGFWLPEPEGLLASCARTVVGFTTGGAFSYRRGVCAGIGFAPATALSGSQEGLKVDKKGRLLLVRNKEETVYHFAWVKVATMGQN